MARPHIEPLVDRDVPFRKRTLPGFPMSVPAMKLPRGITGLMFCNYGELPTGGGRKSQTGRQ